MFLDSEGDTLLSSDGREGENCKVSGVLRLRCFQIVVAQEASQAGYTKAKATEMGVNRGRKRGGRTVKSDFN